MTMSYLYTRGGSSNRRQRCRHQTFSLLLLLLALHFLLPSVVHADICFMLYQNADNLLEFSMRQSLKQYIHSPAIQDPTVTSWVYFDALNNLPRDKNSPPKGDTSGPNKKEELPVDLAQQAIPTTPLEDVWTEDGSQLLTDASATKLEESYYLSYHHDSQKMQVHKETAEEQDSDDPGTLWGFVGYAMEDCISKGSTEFMLILNGYGEGSNGFGGDDHPQRQGQRQRRRLPTISMPGPGKDPMLPEDPVQVPSISKPGPGKEPVGPNKGQSMATATTTTTDPMRPDHEVPAQVPAISKPGPGKEPVGPTKGQSIATATTTTTDPMRPDHEVPAPSISKPVPGKEPVGPNKGQTMISTATTGTMTPIHDPAPSISKPGPGKDPSVGPNRGQTMISTATTTPIHVESHEDVVMALKQVLKDLKGGPAKLDVLGFDAHFMQTFHAIHKYKDVTKHMLASESLMPQHGLAYETLSDTSSAKALAAQMVTEFVQQPQNEDGHHDTPKTLSLVDTGLPFETYLKTANDFLGAMLDLLHDKRTLDAHFFAHFHRARSQAVTYAKECAIDPGSFTAQLAALCDPDPDSQLAKTAHACNEAYNRMFIAREFGPGTVVGTGMLLDLPLIREYERNPDYWKDILLLKSDKSAQLEMPNYVPFFEAYLSAQQMDERDIREEMDSVCRNRAGDTTIISNAEPVEIQPLPSLSHMSRHFVEGGTPEEHHGMTNPGANGLFIEPKAFYDSASGDIFVETMVHVAATSVDAYYGLNITNLLPHFKESNHKGKEEGASRKKLRRKLGPSLTSSKIDETASEGDFVILYGGKAPGNFELTFVINEPVMEWHAVWDQQFYVIKDGTNSQEFHLVFVKEPEEPGTNNAKQVEVVFFPDYNNKIRQDMAVKVGTSLAAAVDPGGEYAGSNGFLEVHTDPTTGKDTFTLYETHCKIDFLGRESCGVREPIGGFIAPVVPVRGIVHGKALETSVGGPTGKVLDWSGVQGWTMEAMSHTELMETFQARSVVLELVAKSFDEGITDLRSFDVTGGSASVKKPKEEEDTTETTPTTLPAPVKQNHGDVAKCKPAIQSTTIEGNVARQALTGDMNVLAHTQCEQNPWWMVDLFSYRSISSVVITNRQDCCFERLDGVVVQLLDEYDQTIAFVQHNPESDGPVQPSWTATFDGQQARKVRVSIQRPEGTCDFLNLAAVQVMSEECTEEDSCGHEGPGCDYGNIALCKKEATQSSTYVSPDDLTGQNSAALRATDGSLTLSHTNCEPAPWWELDLQSERPVTEIVIKNREDCCFERLNGLKIELMNQFNQLTGLFQHDPLSGPIQPMLIVHFDSVTTKKVRLSLEQSPGETCKFMNLEEVQVYSDCLEGDACRTETGCPASGR